MRVLLFLLIAAFSGRPAASDESATSALPVLRDDCSLTLTVGASEVRACEGVPVTASLRDATGVPVTSGWITFAADGGANPPLPVPLSAGGTASANASGLVPGVHQLTATYVRGGGGGAAPGARQLGGGGAALSHCQEGTSPPIAVGVTKGLPALAVTAVPSGGLAPGTPTGCDMGKAAFYVSVFPKAAQAGSGGGGSGCATPTGVVSVYLVRGEVSAADVAGDWDGPVSNAAASAVSGLRDGAATAVSAAATAALGGGGGNGGGGAAASTTARTPPLASAATTALAAAAGNGGGPGAVLPDTLTALVKSAGRTVETVRGGGGGGEAGPAPSAPGAGAGDVPPPSPVAPVEAAAPAATAPPAPTTPPLPPPAATTAPTAATSTTPAPSPPPHTSTAGDLPTALRVFVDTFNAEVGGSGASAAPAAVPDAAPATTPPPRPLPAKPSSSSATWGEVALAKARSPGRALLAGPLPALPATPFAGLAARRADTPLLGHRLLGVGVLVPSDFLPGAPAAATVKPGSRMAGGAATSGPSMPRPPPPGSPGGPAPLLPGKHTVVVQYAGDDVFERGVGVVPWDIADGCGVL